MTRVPLALDEHFRDLAPRLRRLHDAEPWPHFFDLRLSEWEILLRLAGPWLTPGRWLDIGSGNSASTLLLAAGGYRVIGIDLPGRSWDTHSYGADLHTELWEGLGCRPAVVWGSAASLPFRAGSFDGVFSSYAIQYLPDLDGGFRELARVLRTDGTAILVLPSRLERLYAVSSMWQEIAREVAARVARRRPSPRLGTNGPSAPGEQSGLWAQLRRRFPRFPLPTSDSPWRGFGEEVRTYGLGAWRRRARAAGFAVEGIATTSVTLRGLGQWVVSPWRLHRALRRVQIAVQRGPLGRVVARFGENYLLVLSKERVA